MGKVRKLRKKYRTFCSENNTKSVSEPKETESLNSLILKSLSRQNEKLDIFDVKSTTSISKSIRSCVSGIKKKQKHKLRHELFLNKIEASQRSSLDTKKPERGRMTKRLQSNSDLLRAGSRGITSGTPAHQQDQTLAKNYMFKGMSKIRSKNLMNDIFLFKKNLMEDSFHSNPHDTVAIKTLEKLGNEISPFQ